MELDDLVRKVMSQRENQEQAVHEDADGLAQALVGTEYANEALEEIREARRTRGDSLDG